MPTRLAVTCAFSLSLFFQSAIAQPSNQTTFSFNIYECCRLLDGEPTSFRARSFENYTKNGTGSVTVNTADIEPNGMAFIQAMTLAVRTENLTYDFNLARDDVRYNGLPPGIRFNATGQPWFFDADGMSFTIVSKAKKFAGAPYIIFDYTTNEPGLIADKPILNRYGLTDIVTQFDIENRNPENVNATWLSGGFHMRGQGGEYTDDNEIINPDLKSFQGEFSFEERYRAKKIAVLFLLPAFGRPDEAEEAVKSLKDIVAAKAAEHNIEVDYYQGIGRNLMLEIATHWPSPLSLAKTAAGLRNYARQSLAFQTQVTETIFRLYRAVSPSDNIIQLVENQILEIAKSTSVDYEEIIIIAYSTSTQDVASAISNLIKDNKISSEEVSKFSTVYIAPTASSTLFSEGTYTLESNDKFATSVSSLTPNATNLSSDNNLVRIVWLDALGHNLLRSYIKPEIPPSSFTDTRTGENGIEANVDSALE